MSLLGGTARHHHHASGSERSNPDLRVHRDLANSDPAGAGTALLDVLLRIPRGSPERRRRRDLGHHRPVRCCRDTCLCFGGDGLLGWVVKEDRRTVLISDVWTLAVELGRVVECVEPLHQTLIADLLRIELDLHRLGMAGPVTANLLVGGFVGMAAGVSDRGVGDTGESAESVFDAPETAGCK